MTHYVSLFALDVKGRVLLCKSGDESQHSPHEWGFPGWSGTGVETPGETLLRKIRRTNGLWPHSLSKRSVECIGGTDGEGDHHIFTGNCTVMVPEVEEPGKPVEWCWAKPTKVRELKLPPSHLEFFERDWLERQVEVYAQNELPCYDAYAQVLEEVLGELRGRWAPLAIVQARTKKVPSFAEKCLRQASKNNDPAHELTDLCGGRIIATTVAEVQLLCRQIEKLFTIEERDDTGARHATDAFGYLSVHYLIRIKDGHDEILGVPVPSEIGKRVAEVQVRTMLQHAHSEVTHDRLYKSGFKTPKQHEREAARMAATLETADGVFDRFVTQLDAYVGEYAAHIPPDERRRRIEDLNLLIKREPKEVEQAPLALRIARLSRAAWAWDEVIGALEKYEKVECDDQATVQMELGHALCRKHISKPKSRDFAYGIRLLGLVARPGDRLDESLEDDDRIRRATALGWLGRVQILARGNRKAARAALLGAVRLMPDDPYPLCTLVELEAMSKEDAKQLDLLAPSLRQAALRCKEHIKAGIEVTRAWLALSKINLFLGEDACALEALCLAASCTDSSYPLADLKHHLDNLKDTVSDSRPFVQILDQATQLLVIEAEVQASKADRENHDWHPLENRAKFEQSEEILIVAGATGDIDEKTLKVYEGHLRAVLGGFNGQILGGGTTAGVSGLLAGIVKERRTAGSGKIRLTGYVPANLPHGASRADGYTEFVTTPGVSAFSRREPLQMWTDLLVSGVDPREVILLCLGGGEISAAELALAWALGAKAAVIDDPSQAARRFRELRDWSDASCDKAMLIPDDPATLAAFLRFKTPADDSTWNGIWGRRGRAVHEGYLRDQHKRAKEPNLLPWELLPDDLKNSNRHQAAFSVEILLTQNYMIEKVEMKPAEIPLPTFEKGEVDRMAEAEHGRWNAERLHQGWRHGQEKDVEGKISPALVPWEDLPKEIREYDREAVRNWPRILAEAGWMVVKMVE